MGNKRLLASALLMISPLAAQATETSYTFDSVSAVRERNSNISITGVLVGETSPTTISAPTGSGPTERCDRLYNLVLSQPGAYLLTVTIDVSYTTLPPDPTPILTTLFVGCQVALKP